MLSKIWLILLVMFELKEGEVIIDDCGPFGTDKRLKNCSQCLQVAYRVFIVRMADNSLREVGLCGTHFNAASRRCPEVRRGLLPCLVHRHIA